MKPFYVTTPIYYVNDLPHIGHIYTTVVADAVARFHRLIGDDVRFLTGTDEHGQKIEKAANEAGVTPQALADRVVARYRELWPKLGISNDDFIRTTEMRHRRGVEEMIRRLRASGDLYQAPHSGWYCTGCETFYTEKELGDGKTCPDHGTPAIWQEEENWFFRLSRYGDKLLQHYETHPGFIRPETRRNEVTSFVRGGLKDLSVSRSNLSWGIPFPDSPGHVVYVWLDALTNYMTALGFGADDDRLYRRYWPASVQFVGKDILRFHAVYWPAFLMSAGLPLPECIHAHGWWLRDDRKMSKSVGNVVRPDHLIADFGPDALRYFLLREMTFGQDASFSDEAFVARFNADLANDLGNTVSRALKMAGDWFDGRTPFATCDDNPILVSSREVIPAWTEAMAEHRFHEALAAAWRLLAEINQYIVTREPWAIHKAEGQSERLARVCWNTLEGLRLVAILIEPAMPQTAAAIRARLGLAAAPTAADLVWGRLPTGQPLGAGGALFPRIDKKQYLAPAKAKEAPVTDTPAAPPSPLPSAPATAVAPAVESPLISIDDFFRADLRVAEIIAAEPVPKSSKLIKLQVRIGESERTVVAGIAKRYSAAELVGRKVVVVANLQPAKLMGIESQGMVLAASIDGEPSLVAVDPAVPSGTRVK